MFCPNCGTQLDAGDYKCLKCDWTWEQVESHEKTVKKSNTNLKRNLLIMSFFIIIIVATLFIIYINSDSYKIQKSINLIDKGEYVSAISAIKNLPTEQRDIIINFIEVEKTVKEFLIVTEKNNMNNSFVAFQKFYSAFEDFNSNNSGNDLPQKLSDRFFCYLYACMAIRDDIIENTEFYTALYDIQLAMMNDVFINQEGFTLTLYKLKEQTNKSIKASGLLEKYFLKSNKIKLTDYGVSDHCYTNKINDNYIEIPLSSFLSDILDSFINKCNSSISSNLNFINKYSSKYSLYEEFRQESSQQYYEVDIHKNLNPINLYIDIETNRDLIVNYLKIELFYYFITGNIPY